jgi:plasmid stabilization system protein ParE
MKKALIIRPDAELDLAEAYSWYEARVSGLGSDFLLSIDASLSSIQRTPEMYLIVYKNVRRGLVRRFPYGVFYVVEEDRIVILGILHARRDPKTWQD